MVERYYGVRRIGASRRLIISIYLIESLLQHRLIDLLNCVCRLFLVADKRWPFWTLVQAAAGIYYENNGESTGSSFVALMLVAIRLKNWMQLEVGTRPLTSSIPPPPAIPKNTHSLCFICEKAFHDEKTARLCVNSKGQVAHAACLSDNARLILPSA